MSEERNPLQMWIVHLYIASGGSLVLAVLCFYGGFTLTTSIRFAYLIPGAALVFVAYMGGVLARIVMKQEARLNRLEAGRPTAGIKPTKGDIQVQNAEQGASADRPRD